MICKLAFRNVISNGWRSFTNTLVISIVLIVIIWMQAMYYSWIKLAETQQMEWEYGKGMLRERSYDPNDPFSWEDSFATISKEQGKAIQNRELIPILLTPSTIYPHGRMMSAILKGIPWNQKYLKIPSEILNPQNKDIIPVLIGNSMAKSTRLEEDDIFSIRVKDKNGAYNAIDVIVTDIVSIPAPTADIGSVWIDLNALRSVKAMNNEVTYLVMTDTQQAILENEKFRYIPKKEYFADLYQMLENERFLQVLLYGLLLLLAMLAVFDTQTLAVFKRRREIGTLSALGLTKAKITLLFTLEGALYMLLATIMSLTLGFPLFWYFAKYGFAMPSGYEDMGIQGFSEPIRFVYPVGEITVVLSLIFLLTIVVSWIPTRKIAKLNPIDALRGKVD